MKTKPKIKVFNQTYQKKPTKQTRTKKISTPIGRLGIIWSLRRTKNIGQKGWEDGGYGENRMDGNVEGGEGVEATE